MPSSLTTAPVRIPLVNVFAKVPDPRDPRGRRHELPVVLTVAAAAVLAGAKTLVAVDEWLSEADRDALSQLGIEQDVVLPSESTIRRTLARLDAQDLDARLGTWMNTRIRQAAGRRVIAVDGKSMRGATASGAMPHLLAALEHDRQVVVGQRAVPDKGSEIPELKDLLVPMDLADVVVTADALHCQRDTAAWLTSRRADYVLTVKGNQPGLRNALKRLPWAKVPAHTYRDRAHGRKITRTIKSIEVPDWSDWPGAAQVAQVRRTRIIKGRKHVEVVYVICSVPMTDAGPAVLAHWVQGHWQVENALHWVRDVTFDEDRHQLRIGAGPQVMATLRNTAISLLRLTGWSNIAAGLRHHARHSTRPIELLTTA